MATGRHVNILCPDLPISWVLYLSEPWLFFFFQCHVMMPRNNDVLICKYVRANHFSKCGTWLNDNWPGFLAMLVHIQEFWEVSMSNQCINCSQEQ